MITEATIRKTILAIIFLTLGLDAMAQQVSGTITDPKGEALVGVNVYIKGSYDGATTDFDGKYSFNTDQTGEQILIISFMGFKNQEIPIDLSQDQEVSIAMKEEVSKLTGVTITAGSFEASDEKKAVVLKSLDIAMTAGATADITGALNTLPGTTTNGESGRLFVRGGTANESQAFIDGVLVHNFYTASPNNVPSRSRFSPFLFKGTFFSTGGYSAEYGQALSSVISLTSNDIPEETRTDISLMTVGGDVSRTEKWENGSVFGQVQYTDLNPYNSLVNQEYHWEKGFQSTAGTFMLRQKIKGDNMLKVYANYDQAGFVIHFPNINYPELDRVDIVNRNRYFNTSYKHAIGDNSMAYFGVSHGLTKEDISFNDVDVDDEQESLHLKSYVITDIENVSIKTGAEVISLDHTEIANLEDGSVNNSSYQNTLSAAFAESDYYITNDPVSYTHLTLPTTSRV